MERLREVDDMDEQREAVLLGRLAREPRSQAEKEESILDLYEWLLARDVPSDFDGLARKKAELLVEHEGAWPSLIEDSRSNPLAWEALQALVSLLRKRSLPLVFRPPLSDWILDVASGDRERPIVLGRRGGQFEYRYLVIAVLIKRLHDEFGRPYAPPSKDSACHVAAERLKEPVETVRAIWRKNKQDVRAAMDKMPSLG